jgi:hypothetical protein
MKLTLLKKILTDRKTVIKRATSIVSPSDGDFVIGPCRLQRPGMTAGNRQQKARDPGTQGVIRREDLGPVSNSRRIPGSTPSDHERRAWAESTL